MCVYVSVCSCLSVCASSVYDVWLCIFLFSVCLFSQCDLKVITDAKGGMFYRDHLPLVGEDLTVTAGYYEIGNQVIVDQEVDVVRSLQQGYGGWAEGMRDVSKINS